MDAKQMPMQGRITPAPHGARERQVPTTLRRELLDEEQLKLDVRS
jgi:hypothetical protein